MIARHRSLDEFPLHPVSAVGATDLVALQPMSTRMRCQFPQTSGRRAFATKGGGHRLKGPARESASK
jgi:hypothetical protein